MSREDDNKYVVRRFNEELVRYFATGDTEPLLALVAPDATLAIPGMPPNVEGLKTALPMFRAALSGFEMETHDVVADGDLVAYRVTWTARHDGDLMGVPATGKTVAVTETHIDRIRDGKIVEHGGDWDRIGLLEQIGAIPTPA